MSFLGPLVPLFWISGDVSSGFQSQSGLPYLYCGGERNVRSPSRNLDVSQIYQDHLNDF